MPSTGYVLASVASTYNSDFLDPQVWANVHNILNSSTASFSSLSVSFTVISVQTNAVFLVETGQLGNNIALLEIWPNFGGFQVVDYGGALSVYGLNSTLVTPAIVSSPTFGVTIACTMNSTAFIVATNFAANFPSPIPTDAIITDIDVRFSRVVSTGRIGSDARIAFVEMNIDYDLPSEANPLFFGGGNC